MLMDAVPERFIAHRPMAVAVRGAFEYAPSPTPLDDLFVRTVGHRDDRELLFSTCVDLMATVVCRVKPSVLAAYQDHIPVNVTAVYARLARVPVRDRPTEDALRADDLADGTGWGRVGGCEPGPVSEGGPGAEEAEPAPHPVPRGQTHLHLTAAQG